MRNAVKAEHEKSLEAFIKVNGCLIKVCLRWPRLDGGVATHFRCAAMQSLSCRFHSTSYDPIKSVCECEGDIEYAGSVDADPVFSVLSLNVLINARTANVGTHVTVVHSHQAMLNTFRCDGGGVIGQVKFLNGEDLGTHF